MLGLYAGSTRHRFVVAAAVLYLASSSRKAQAAAPPCNSLTNTVYLQVGDTQEPLMKALGHKLRASQKPVTLVYYLSGSCTNINTMYGASPLLKTNPSYVPSQAEVPGWDPSQPSPTCTIDTTAGVPLDVANSNVFVSACTQAAAPTGIGTFQGAIQPYVFIAPTTSTQQAITAEEAYLLFGADDFISPWGDLTTMFIRATTKSTLVSMAAAIHVPPAKFKGTVAASSSAVLSSVSNSPNAEATIGLLGAEVYDGNRTYVKSLAFKTFGQKYAYYPDSTSTARDKHNLRDGHYVIWSPTVYLAPVDAAGTIVNANAKYVVDLIQGKAVAPDFDPLAVGISVGLVPDCAMKVTRTVEAGDLSLYTPAEPCGCFFESLVGQASATCVACSTTTPCASGACRHGFCEAK